MAVPTSITDLSITAASNSPAGTDTVTTNDGPDDYIRAIAAIIRREQAQATNTASASTVDLGAIATGSYVHITGVTTITAFGTVAAGVERIVVFDGVLTLTHSAGIILPGGANITTAAGDVAVFRSEGSGNWRCVSYERSSKQTGGFWIDEATVGTVHKIADRLFIDDAVQFSGDWSGVDNDYSPIPRWPSREASLLSWSSVGRNSIVGLSLTSKGVTSPGGTPASADSAIGVIGIAVNDYVGADNRNSFGGYFESWKGSGSIKAAFGVEIDVGNDSVTDTTNNPYSPFGAGTFGLNISAGGSKGSAYANPSACGIVIGNNTQSFNKGIVFGATAITGTDGVTGVGIAVEFAKGHVISWREAAGTTTNLYSSVASTANKVSQEFTDNIIRFLGSGGNSLGQFENVASSVNYARIIPAITTASPGIMAGGSDTDIDLKLVPKGSGLIRFGDYSAIGAETLSGFITIKTEAGSTIKLAVVA